MTSSESEGPPPPRKRSRTSGENGEATKKARGRPRVDTQDASAADRRRTQIRLAQRAYRQRKETTISSLKKHVDELRSTIEQMNRACLNLNDAALRYGLATLHPELARELNDVTETFVRLAKVATLDSNLDPDDEAQEIDIDPAAELHKAATAARASMEAQHGQLALSSTRASNSIEVGWGYTATLAPHPNVTKSQENTFQPSSLFPPMQTSASEAWKRAGIAYYGKLPEHANRVTIGHVLDQSGQMGTNLDIDKEQLPFGLVDSPMHAMSPFPVHPQLFPIETTPKVTPPLSRTTTPPQLSQSPTSTISARTMQPDYTYSFQETTFARRLTRAALECGFQLLSSAAQRPAVINYIFRLSLKYATVDELLTKFRELLSRGTDESLDVYDTPFIHLGGAGTHYPRRNERGEIEPRPNSWYVRSIGPLKKLRVENTSNPGDFKEFEVDLTGFDGEWFDAQDVQGYLEQEKGLYIDPQQTFAHAFIEVDDDSLTNPASLAYSRDLNINLNLSASNHTSSLPQESPALSSASSINTSSNSTPGTSISPGTFSGPEPAFGLDMSLPILNNSNKFNTDPIATLEEPLGLDLAGSFPTNVNSGLHHSIADGFNSSDFDGLNLAMDLIGSESQIPTVKQKRKQPVWVEVSKLIDEIIKHGVCLGRSPGFRKRDVDAAFKLALIPAYS